ncbi:MAG TPA: hypothetical protein ENF74_02630 [Firmicutes bacterium]|nr:hypothetical protein [Bacillota bacterium]
MEDSKLYELVLGRLGGCGPVLDVGCGSCGLAVFLRGCRGGEAGFGVRNEVLRSLNDEVSK